MTPRNDFENGLRAGKQEATLENVRDDIAAFREEWKTQAPIVAAHTESIKWLKRLVFSLYGLYLAGVGFVIKMFLEK